MKPETLDALLIDRALGALSPEVDELLESYLVRNPDAVRQAGSLASVVQLARTAVGGPVESTGFSPPMDRVRKALRAQRRRAFRWELGKLAACLLLGLGVGLVSRSGGGTDPGRDPAEAAVRPPIAAAEAAIVSGGRNGFWSLANLAPGRSEQAAAGIRQDSRYRLHWDSPVRMPHLEEDL